MSEVPPQFERSYSFTNFSTYTPNLQQPGNKIDQELNNVRTSVNATIDRLSEIQRDDGYLDSTSLDFNDIFTGLSTQLSLTYAAINSPVFTGSPTAPTPNQYDASSKIATTSFVKNQNYATISDLATLQSSLAGYLTIGGGTISGNLIVDAGEGSAGHYETTEMFVTRTDAGPGQSNAYGALYNGGLEIGDSAGNWAELTTAHLRFGDGTIQTSAATTFTGGTLTSQLQVSAAGLKNALNENFIIDAYNDAGAGTHNLFKFNPFGGGLELPTGSSGIKFGDNTTQVTAGLPLTGGTVTGNLTINKLMPAFLGDPGYTKTTTIDGAGISGTFTDDGGNENYTYNLNKNGVWGYSGDNWGLTSSGLTLDGWASITQALGLSFGTGFNRYDSESITFSDATVQTTAYNPEVLNGYLPLTGGTVTLADQAKVIINQTTCDVSVFEINDPTWNWNISMGSGYIQLFDNGNQVVELSVEEGSHFRNTQLSMHDSILLLGGNSTLRFEDDSVQSTAGLPLTGGIMSGAIRFDSVGTQNISKGSFDSGRGGYNGVSLVCAVDYELNWQAGYLKALNSGGFNVPINVESDIVLSKYVEGDGNETPSSHTITTTISLDGSIYFDGDDSWDDHNWGISQNGVNGSSSGDDHWSLGVSGVQNGGNGSHENWYLNADAVGRTGANGADPWSFGKDGAKFVDGTIQTTAFNPPVDVDSFSLANTGAGGNGWTNSPFFYHLRLEDTLTFGDNSVQTTAFIPANYATTTSLSNYALLSGATFTGKLNLNPAGTTTAPLNIKTGISPTTAVAGDVWISATNLAYKDSTGVTRNTISTSTSNTFTNFQNITQGNSVNPSLAVTQTGAGGGVLITNTGAGYSFKVEDATSPDATPFAIDQNGRVGIGVAPDATVALTLDSTGIKVNGATLVPASAVTNSPITSGNMAHSEYTKELLITINGVNYAIVLRVV